MKKPEPTLNEMRLALTRGKTKHEHAHEKARLNAIKMLGLHEKNTAEDRARALGFDLNENLYHGTNSDFPAFEKHPRYGAGTYATEDPEIADIYAESERREGNAHPNVLPIVARGKKLTVSDLHPEDPHTGGWFRDNMAKATGMPKTRRMEEQLPTHGYDRLQINDMSDLGGVQTQHMFPDPKVIRSRFAAFDPHRVEENDLLAAKGGEVHMAEGGSGDDYRGSHQAPGPHFGAPMHDVSSNGMYPEDFYSPKGAHYYGNINDPIDRETHRQVLNVRGKPDAMVTIHRAIPTYVHEAAMKTEDPIKHMIRHGDWVAIHKGYAKIHGEGPLKGKYKIASMRVPAKHVWTNADSIHEWGYHPDKVTHKADGGKVLYHGTPHTKSVIKRFQPKGGGDFGAGIYMTTSPESASEYSKGISGQHHGAVYPLHANIKNPLVVKDKYEMNHIFDSNDTNKPIHEYLQSKGYDGIHVTKPKEDSDEQYFVAFHPKQVKSSITGKADGGEVKGRPMNEPTLAQMRLEVARHSNPAVMNNIGVNEAVDIDPKIFINPNPNSSGLPDVGGVKTPKGPLPIGGVDVNPMMAGTQFMPQQPQQQPPQGQQSPFPSMAPSGSGSPPDQSNILNLTPQGQAMSAMKPPMTPNMADGGSINDMVRQRMIAEGKINLNPAHPKTDRRPFENSAQRNKRMPKNSTYPESTDPMDKFKEQAIMRLALAQRNKVPHLAEGGQPIEGEKYLTTNNPKRILFPAEGYGDVKGIVVPRHMWHGNNKVNGMKEINKARAEVYGSENRQPLNIGQIGRIHKQVLKDHFAKPIDEQTSAEKEALERLRKAKHIGKNANTLDESEKLDTVRHEYDDRGRSHVGYASKGIAGYALYTSGHGENEKHHILNTCPGQTTGCGGGHDENGIVDTSKGTCFAPNAESQYVNASIRRASHEQSKHDPAMTKDWILAHTGSLRQASQQADKKNQRLLFRPNVVDETDVSSRHVLRHLNKQRQAIGKPPIIANSYAKTNELHDPENGYFVTHSNVGPKVKHGQSISENIARDKQRIRSTVGATDASGKDFVNDDGNKTPPKNSYMVTDVKRGSPMSKVMQRALKYAKYWSAGREDHEISDEEKQEGEEGHFDGKGRPTTEEKAHFGHITFNGKRYDYQKQHILHPRLVQVGVNKDGTAHMIPTDSRFKDNEFLPKNRFMTKNGKEAGAILMTTPTESTSRVGHHTSFTHHVNPKHIDYAIRNNGEYEVDPPLQQEMALGKEYVAPQEIKIMKKPKKFAMGGSVSSDDDLGADDFLAFPEQNHHAQRILAKRIGVKDCHQVDPIHYYRKKAK